MGINVKKLEEKGKNQKREKSGKSFNLTPTPFGSERSICEMGTKINLNLRQVKLAMYLLTPKVGMQQQPIQWHTKCSLLSSTIVLSDCFLCAQHVEHK